MFLKPRLMDETAIPLDAAMQKRAQSLLVDFVYQQSFMAQIASFFCATLLFLGLYHYREGNNTAVIVWYIFFLLVTTARILLIYFYTLKTEYVALWRKLFVVGVFVSGVAWGLTGTWLFLHASHAQQMLIILILAGITAGAVPLLAADLVAAIAFLTPVLLPLIIQLFFRKDTQYYLFSFSIAAYFIYVLLLARKTYRLLKQTINLQFEKESLLKELNEKKSQLELANKKLHDASVRDLLTGLANRKLFMSVLAETLKRAENEQKSLAVLYINLDNFRFINDAYGYDIGDHLLNIIVARIKQNIQSSDVIGRLGGDEFGVILEGRRHSDEVMQVASQICQVLTQQFIVSSYGINISVSIGISIYPVDDIEPNTLVKKAYQAMRYVKEHGRNNVHCSTFLSK